MSDMTVIRQDANLITDLILHGDMKRLGAAQKVEYYTRFCESLGLNPLTQPFQYIVLNGKERLYATKDATEQLRKIHGVSITSVDGKQVGDVYVVTAKGHDKTGRTDSSTGVVTIGTLKGDALANALMKAETKAKRRLTLSICGLGMLDETELETIPDARPIKAIIAEREIPDMSKAREEIGKLIERYEPLLSQAFIEACKLDMEGATVEALREIYLSIKVEGAKAEREEQGGVGKVAQAERFRNRKDDITEDDLAEPELPDGDPEQMEIF